MRDCAALSRFVSGVDAGPCLAVMGCDEASCRQSVGNDATERPPAKQLPTGVLARVIGSLCARYFTLNASHFVVTAACVAVLVIAAVIRYAPFLAGLYFQL